ncbi:FkbM family methyltransferase [Tardiphaga sp. 862_B3_N1_1]|uniref:FkbM family methyltransferase n=1 Tax=Tardiphaga sp. 862_B3_N1_1 TaxID=3240763 RepID=UPI003F8BA095
MATAQQSLDTHSIEVDGQAFLVHCSNQMEKMRAGSFMTKEPETVRWLKAEMRANTVFWDVGANLGLFSLYAATLQSKARILAFEPAAHNYARLCENIAINGFHNVLPFSVALGGDKLAFAELHLSKLEAGSSIHHVGAKSPWAIDEAVFRQPCVTISVDSMVLDHGFPAPTLLKIDVDGLELDILRTAKTVLSKVQSILVELDANDSFETSGASEILIGCGFALSETSSRQKTINSKLPRNYIWNRADS